MKSKRPDKIITKRFDYRETVIEENVPNESGVYAIWCARVQRCIYVGKAENINTRLMQHLKMESHSKDLHNWIENYYDYMKFSFKLVKKNLLSKTEDQVWDQLRPIENKARPRISNDQEKKS